MIDPALERDSLEGDDFVDGSREDGVAGGRTGRTVGMRSLISCSGRIPFAGTWGERKGVRLCGESSGWAVECRDMPGRKLGGGTRGDRFPPSVEDDGDTDWGI